MCRMLQGVHRRSATERALACLHRFVLVPRRFSNGSQTSHRSEAIGIDRLASPVQNTRLQPTQSLQLSKRCIAVHAVA